MARRRGRAPVANPCLALARRSGSPGRFVPYLVAVVLFSGCAGGSLSAMSRVGTAHLGKTYDVAFPGLALDDRAARDRLLDITPRPVADLSAAEIGLARFFLGAGLGWAFPDSLSLKSGTTFELSTAFDIGRAATIEILPWGLWSLPDHPVPGADSSLDMQPLLATLQIRLWEGGKGRFYLGGGGGYSWNNYALGAAHRSAVMSGLGLTSYNAVASDGWLTHFVGGWEWYSTADAKLILGVELRYVMGQIDMTQYLEAATKTDTIDLGVYTFRVGLTGHF